MKNIIKQKARYLKEYTELFNKIAIDAKQELMSVHKKAYKEDKDSVNLEEVTRDTLYIQGFYQLDIKELQNELLYIYNFALTVDPELELDEETLGLVTLLKQSIASRIFTLEGGEFKEIGRASCRERV